MPTRFDTLDFHLLCQKGTRVLSYLFADAIMQSSFLVKEKIHNSRNEMNLSRNPYRVFYLRV